MFRTDCNNVSVPSRLSYTTATVSGVLCLLTVSGNLFVCLAVFIDPHRDLRKPFNYFVVNLAIADLIVGCVTEPISVYYHIKEGLGGPIDKIELRSVHASFFISCTASVLSFSLLAFERYTAVVSPVKYRFYFSVSRFLALVVLVWLGSVCLTIVYVFTNFIFHAFVFIDLAVGWTLAVFLFTYVKILRSFKQRTENVSTMSGNSKARANLYNMKLTKTYMIVLSIFLVCFTPACIAIYIVTWCKTCSCLTVHYLRDITIMIILFSSALNPFVYAFRFGNFRRAVRDIFQRCISFFPRRASELRRHWWNIKPVSDLKSFKRISKCLQTLGHDMVAVQVTCHERARVFYRDFQTWVGITK